MQHLQPQQRGGYNSLPARKEGAKHVSDSKSVGGNRGGDGSDANVSG